MRNIVKADTKQDAVKSMLSIDKILADTITRRLEIEEERKKINSLWRASKEYKRLKELSKEEKQLVVVQHEQNGARRFCYALLEKFGIEPQTNLTRLAKKNDAVKELIGA